MIISRRPSLDFSGRLPRQITTKLTVMRHGRLRTRPGLALLSGTPMESFIAVLLLQLTADQ
ncbi:hypothetical protein RchiOBHm_Chr2g0130771 [Rosa chinensis]|uniref:Uncharacterized protein n=1 Tax=Rosa chinensis TaxID=74649 RepID=A0A2P6RUX3_ROSCH|nr:hypothetical protein RchiOBHm_Chr2g0130771 [Rosa chinensis]